MQGLKLLLTVFSFTIAAVSTAQVKMQQDARFYTVSGILKDSVSNEPLEMATVSIARIIDSSVIQSGISDKKGKFELMNIPAGQFFLNISSVTYGRSSRLVSITGSTAGIDLGILPIVSNSNLMEEVVITLPPIVMNKDTVEFRASGFPTRPNAVIEDLLKKIPGIEVDSDGNVIANGDTIKRILVDGKRFFGNDPKMATRNLTADMVDKVQMFEMLSDQASFTGVDDGSGEQVLNIKIKANRKKGTFGRATVGYGTNDRYEASAVLNIFNKSKQFSIISGANNLNKQAFSEQDFSGSGGRGRGGMHRMRGRGSNRPGEGITISKTLGLNYNDEWGSKTKVSGSYFYNNSDRTNSSLSNKQIFTSDSLVFVNAEQSSRSLTGNHRFNMNIEHTVNPRTRITIRPDFSFSENENLSQSESASNSSKNNFLNSASNKNNFLTTQPNGGVSMNYLHRFNKRNRSISVNAEGNFSLSKGSGYNNGVITKAVYSDFETDSLNQFILQDNKSFRYGTRVSYTEPLDSNRYLELNIGINNNISSTARIANEFNKANSKYDKLVTGQSNDVSSDFYRQSAGFNLRTQFEKYDYTIGLNVQHSELNSINVIKMTNVNQQQWNFFPTAQFNYSFDETKRLRVNYNGSSNQPTASQLQDIRDSTDLLNIRTGNPNLKPEFNHSVNFHYNVFNRQSFRSMFASIRITTSKNKIINSNILKNGVSESMPINSNGFYNVNGNISFGLPIKPKVLSLNLSTNLGYSHATSFQNNLENISRNLNAGERVTLNLNLKDKLDISANGGFSFVKATYSIDPDRNNNFYRYNASVDVSYRFPMDIIMESEINYNANKGNADGFNQSYTMMNASLAKQFLKNNAGTIKFSAFDLLGQNNNIDRNVTDLAIEDIRSEVLTRYFMISFNYNFNRFGGNSSRSRGNT